MLSLRDVSMGYGARPVLRHICLNVAAGEVVAITGRNGAGRSTLLKAITGQLAVQAGQIILAGQDMTQWPVFQRVRAGVAWVPETKEIFSELSIQDNLLLGCGPGVPRRQQQQALSHMYAKYPLLENLVNRSKRGHVKAGALSGGEQQLLAFARALMRVELPKLLLLDEPTEGLAPPVIEQMKQHLQVLKAQGVAMLLVEQKPAISVTLADCCIILEPGLTNSHVAQE